MTKRKPRPVCRANQSNEHKIRYYMKKEKEGTNYHKQVIIEGTRPNGKKFRLICDEGISRLISRLNSAGIYTKFSCQGDSTRRAYFTVGRTSEKLLALAEKMAEEFWKDRFVHSRVIAGHIVFESWIDKELVLDDLWDCIIKVPHKYD